MSSDRAPWRGRRRAHRQAPNPTRGDRRWSSEQPLSHPVNLWVTCRGNRILAAEAIANRAVPVVIFRENSIPFTVERVLTNRAARITLSYSSSYLTGSVLPDGSRGTPLAPDLLGEAEGIVAFWRGATHPNPHCLLFCPNHGHHVMRASALWEALDRLARPGAVTRVDVTTFGG